MWMMLRQMVELKAQPVAAVEEQNVELAGEFLGIWAMVEEQDVEVAVEGQVREMLPAGNGPHLEDLELKNT